MNNGKFIIVLIAAVVLGVVCLKQNNANKSQKVRLDQLNAQVVQLTEEKKSLEGRLQDIQKQLVSFAKGKSELEIELENAQYQIKQMEESKSLLQSQLDQALGQVKSVTEKIVVPSTKENVAPAAETPAKKTKKSWFSRNKS